MERKIEAALEAYFNSEGWELDIVPSTGDHFATQVFGNALDWRHIGINLTECAKRIAEEIKC